MLKVLVVDDSKAALLDVCEALKDTQCEVFTACDGDNAFEVLEQHPDMSLLISDLNMPVLDGIGLAKRIYFSEFKNKFPIVILTTEFSSELKIEGKSYGVSMWAVKPIKKQDFGNTMLKLKDAFEAKKSQFPAS